MGEFFKRFDTSTVDVSGVKKAKWGILAVVFRFFVFASA